MANEKPKKCAGTRGCNGEGTLPYCVYCMKVAAPKLKPFVEQRRKTNKEREQEIKDQSVIDIKRFRELTEIKDLKRMARNMKKTGQTSTGVRELDIKLALGEGVNIEICIFSLVAEDARHDTGKGDELAKIRNNMSKKGVWSSGSSIIDEKLEERFGPIVTWK